MSLSEGLPTPARLGFYVVGYFKDLVICRDAFTWTNVSEFTVQYSARRQYGTCYCRFKAGADGTVIHSFFLVCRCVAVCSNTSSHRPSHT